MNAEVRVVRSGRVEAVHQGSIAIVDADGNLLRAAGDVDRAFFARSSLKPFQAQVSQRFGAALEGETLALACASHAATPRHLEVVRRMLEEVGIDESVLATPLSWPSSPEGRDAAVRSGARLPQRIFHNCSGKHAGMLRGCVASDLPIETYVSPAHPLQVAVREEVEGLLRRDAGTPGVDGCGAPVYTVSTTELATMFAALATDPDRAEVRATMGANPVLIGGEGREDGLIGTAVGAAKYGAEACLGIAVASEGIGVALKVWDGSVRGVASLAAAALDELGLLTDGLRAGLEEPVLGGGRTVGWLEADVTWR
ncbi:MAG: asparaginase [Acidimicrobiia bacterium]|nr:MAG: asparaginase [Acidimicrobiia bacterium]